MDDQSNESLSRKDKITASEGCKSQCYGNVTAEWLQIFGWPSYTGCRNPWSAEEEPWQTKIHFENRIGLFNTHPQDRRFKDLTCLDKMPFHLKKTVSCSLTMQKHALLPLQICQPMKMVSKL